MYEEDNIESEFLKRPKKNPFHTPDNYFDSMEDRVMRTIQHEEKTKNSSGVAKVYRLLKPVLGLAASFALVFVLVYYPINYFSSDKLAKTQSTDTVTTGTNDFYSIVISAVDENSLVDALSKEETTIEEEINADELVAYLSSDMNDIEIYSEIQN